MKKIIVMFLVLFTCTGCWNYKELTELGIVTAMGISKEDDKFIVDLQLINIIEAGDNGISESPITVVSGEGESVAEAIRAVNMKSSKVFFSSDVEYVLIDKSVINEDLSSVLDFLSRDTKLSLNFLIVTSTDNKPREILSSLSSFNLNPANNLSELIKRGEERYGASYSLSIKDYLDKYLSYGVTPVYPNIYMTGNEEDSENIKDLENSDSDDYVAIKNLVTFDKDGNLINLDVDESFGYNFLQNHVKNAEITCECGDNYFTIETLGSKFDYDDKLDKDKLTVKGEVQAKIFYYGCKENLSKDKTLEMISKKLEEQIGNYVDKTINKAKTNNIDFVGIGNWIYKNNNSYFDFENKDWDTDGLNKLDIDYDIKVTLFKQGNLKGDI